MRNPVKFKWIFLPLFLVITHISYPGPEKFDYLEIYKKATVKKKGPAEEIVEDNTGKKLAKAIYKYNDKNQVVEVLYYKNGKNDGKSLYVYDANGLKQEELYDKTNKLVEKIVYTTNGAGNIIEFEVFDGNNKSVVKWRFQYRNGKVISGSRYIGGELTEKFVNKYDGDSMVQSIFLDNNESAATITENSKNSQVVKRIKKDATGTQSIDYYYDKEGRIVKMIFSREISDQPKVEKTHIFNYSLPYVFNP